jgi:hypothetical protein
VGTLTGTGRLVAVTVVDRQRLILYVRVHDHTDGTQVNILLHRGFSA